MELCCPPIDAGLLSVADADRLAPLLKALAEPSRLRILSAVLERGELCSCDVPELIDRSQPTASHHLSTLVGAGVLVREQRGRWAWFSVDPWATASLRAAFGGVPTQAGPAVQ
jgi:ArsR family transcriptional regulator